MKPRDVTLPLGIMAAIVGVLAFACGNSVPVVIAGGLLMVAGFAAISFGAGR